MQAKVYVQAMAAQGDRSSGALDYAVQADREQFFEEMLGELSMLGIPSDAGESSDALRLEAGNNQRPALDDRSIDNCKIFTSSVNQRPSSGHASLAEPTWPTRPGCGYEREGRSKHHEAENSGILQLLYDQEQKVRV